MVLAASTASLAAVCLSAALGSAQQPVAWQSPATTLATAPAPVIAAPAPAPNPAPTPAPANPPLAALPPAVIAAMNLGLRTLAAAEQLDISDELVIVPDAATALAVISAAGPNQFTPVLIDNGTLNCRENIARFVRAFTPASIRFVPAGKPLADATDLQTRLANLTKAAGEPGKVVPTGAVVVDVRDESSIAGAALARARKQVLISFSAPAQYDQLTPAAAVAISNEITVALDEKKLNWNILGDTIDAVTIVAKLPVKVKFDQPGDIPAGTGPFVCKPGESLALTDLIGRQLRGTTFVGDRWAWTGQISTGVPADALYRVMCSVCLRADSLFGFDGYDNSNPWNTFSITEAAARLRPALKPGLASVQVRSKPDGSAESWVSATGRGLSAGLMLMNTSGNANFFDLLPGRAFAADMPVLSHPAMAHVIHSWSAQSPENWWTIAGRFFSHGGYAYAGSVHEPFLQSFVPQPVFAARLKVNWPFAAAARVDGLTPWRIAVLGDALMLPLSPKPNRIIAVPPGGEGAGKTLEQRAKAAAESKSISEIVALFVLRGQDDRAASVAMLALKGDANAGGSAAKARLDAVTLGQAAMAAFRSGKLAELAELASAYSDTFRDGIVLNPEGGNAEPVEALWMLAVSTGLTTPSAVPDSVLEVLIKVPRPWQDEVLVRDTKWLASVLKSRRNTNVAKRMVQDRLDGSGTNEALKVQLRELLATML